MVQWAGAQVAATTVWLTSNSQLEGTIGRVADTAHTGSFITRRSHLNLLWIYIALLTPMIYIPSAMVKYGEFKTSGNLSWLRVYGAGHEVPAYQPQAALAAFVATLSKKPISST